MNSPIDNASPERLASPSSVLPRDRAVRAPLEFAATDSKDLKAVIALLRQSFQVDSGAPLLDPSYLYWKYYQPGPRWEGSRSYVLRKGDEILAHAAIWPLEIRTEKSLLSGIGFGDWASDSKYPGIGLTLLKHLIALSPFILATGGGDITRKILPRMGFQHWADRAVYSKILRPVRQFRTRPRTALWKELLRMSRNFAWSLKPAASLQGWTAESAMPSDEILSSVENHTGFVHTTPFLNFLLTCPAARFQFLVLRKQGVVRGYAVTSSVGGQGRIADIKIRSGDDTSWSAAIASVLRQLKRDPKIAEVMAFGSVPHLDNALKANGFKERDRRPLVVLHPEKTLSGSPVPQLGMLEDDASFVYDPAFPFLT